jgi:hypothetical protein
MSNRNELYITCQHLKTHEKEWEVCEEEKKEMELVKRRKLEVEASANTQLTIETAVMRKSIYPSTSTQKKKIDQALISMVVNDLVLPSMIEDNGFNNFVSALDPRYVLPSRKTLMRSLIPTRYNLVKASFLQQLREVNSCAITTNFWSACNAENYITVTCHFINSTWELKSCVLATYQVKISRTAKNISAELMKIAIEWDIT